jgi:hypothetical protein
MAPLPVSNVALSSAIWWSPQMAQWRSEIEQGDIQHQIAMMPTLAQDGKPQVHWNQPVVDV